MARGCLDPVASQLLSGDLPIRDRPRSENAWDWLGRRVYFWEHAPSRALPGPEPRRSERASTSVQPRSDADLRRRELDCLVINYCLDLSPVTYDSVRAAFIEGPPAYPGAKIHRETHIQIAVRNLGCILGVFRPNLE